MEKEEKQFVAVILFLVFYLSNYPVSFDLAESEHHIFPCYTVKGEVIDKEESNNDYILYVINEIKTIIDELLDAGIMEVNE